jgi:ketosteroid isomerase-like protein
MKRLVLPAVLAVVAASLVSGPLTAAEPEMTSGSVEKTIIKLELDWGNALAKGDVAWIDGICADDWMITDPEGNLITKEQSDADMKSGALAIESFKIDDLVVHVHGDTAVAFGLETEKSKYKGADSSGQYRFTDTFAKRDGKWMAVATHVTKVVKH